MEDEHIVDSSLEDEFGGEGIKGAFFGVFDGHGGLEAAKFTKSNLLSNIIYDDNFKSDFIAAARNGVKKTDRDFIEWALDSETFSGTTVCAAYLLGRYPFVIHSMR
jgi:protein phosphatase 2C family protein 2/3